VNLVTRDTRNAECHKLIALAYRLKGTMSGSPTGVATRCNGPAEFQCD